jgi:hypothetical protein
MPRFLHAGWLENYLILQAGRRSCKDCMAHKAGLLLQKLLKPYIVAGERQLVHNGRNMLVSYRNSVRMTGWLFRL